MRALLRRAIGFGAIAALAGAVLPARAELAPGDVLVCDFEAGASDLGILFKVDPTTGVRVVLSDFGDIAQGPTGQGPFGVTVRNASSVLVLDNQGLSGNGTLFDVDGSGNRTILSDFHDPAQGPLGLEPVGVALGPNGILVTDKDAGTGARGVVFRIDPVTGSRTVLSDFGDPGQGPVGETPTGIARGLANDILVLDPDAGTNGDGALFFVDPDTGARTLLSDFGDAGQGPTGVNPGGVSLGSAGFLLVADTEAGTGGLGTLFKVDYRTGARTVLSTFGNAAQGATGSDPFFVTLSATGTILVTDDDAGTDIPLDGHPGGNGALFAVNPANGQRTLISDFGDPAKGPTGVDPNGIAIVPLSQPGQYFVVSPFSGTSAAGELLAVDPTTGNRVRVSDFGLSAQGPTGNDPVDLAQGPGGDVFVVDQNVNGSGALFRVNTTLGSRILVSSFGNAAQGPVASSIRGVTLLPDGTLLALAASGAAGGRGALFSVDTTTGNRTVITEFGDAAEGQVGLTPESVIPGPPGFAYVVDADARTGTTSNGVVFLVDLATGQRTVTTDFSAVAQGATGIDPFDLEREAAGTILVADATASPALSGYGVLFRVDASTGNRTILSDFGNALQGPLGANARGVALDGAGGIVVVDNSSGTGNYGLLFTVDATTGARQVLSDFGLASQGPSSANPYAVMRHVDPATGCLLSLDCDDGDPCTDDACGAGLCAYAPAAPPAEVGGVTMGKPGAPGVATLSWSAVPGAGAYDVYRASSSDLGDLLCLSAGVAGTSVDDDGSVPSSGSAYFHLVGASACGKGSLGTDSEGNPRTISSPCP